MSNTSGMFEWPSVTPTSLGWMSKMAAFPPFAFFERDSSDSSQVLLSANADVRWRVSRLRGSVNSPEVWSWKRHSAPSPCIPLFCHFSLAELPKALPRCCAWAPCKAAHRLGGSGLPTVVAPVIIIMATFWGLIVERLTRKSPIQSQSCWAVHAPPSPSRRGRKTAYLEGYGGRKGGGSSRILPRTGQIISMPHTAKSL